MSRNEKALKAAGAVGSATLISRLLGLVREQVFAFFFGASSAMDAFVIAFRIPNLMRDLFAEGAMSSALVPTFVENRERHAERRSWRVAGLVFRVLFVGVSVFAISGIYFAEELVSLFASHFKLVEGKFELTVLLTQVMFPFFPLVALAAAFMGVLNARGLFFLPALASALFNFFSVAVGLLCVWLLPKYGFDPIIGMAVGVVAGGACQALVQLPALYRVGYRWQKKTPQDPPWWKDPALKKMLLLMAPATIGMGATQINILVNSILATSQGTSAVSWLNYAFRLMQFPIGVFGVSLAVATLPQVSRLFVKNDLAGIEVDLSKRLRQVFAINLPASAGLAFLSIPIIQLIFQYGEFSYDDTVATSMALAAYAIGLVFYSGVKVLVPAFYAFGRPRVAVTSSILAVIVNIVLNLILIKPLGYWGLAVGTSITAILNFLYLAVAAKFFLIQKGGQFRLLRLVPSFGIHVFFAVIMGWICYTSHEFLSSMLPEFEELPGLILSRLVRVGLVIAEGVAIVLLLGKLFRVEETTEVLSLVGRRLKRKK